MTILCFKSKGEGEFVQLVLESKHPTTFRPCLRKQPLPSFFMVSDLQDGESDRTETFITNRGPKMIRHVFEEKIFPGHLQGF